MSFHSTCLVCLFTCVSGNASFLKGSGSIVIIYICVDLFAQVSIEYRKKNLTYSYFYENKAAADCYVNEC